MASVEEPETTEARLRLVRCVEGPLETHVSVSFLTLGLEDTLNGHAYEVVLVGTKRGLTVNVRKMNRERDIP